MPMAHGRREPSRWERRRQGRWDRRWGHTERRRWSDRKRGTVLAWTIVISFAAAVGDLAVRWQG
jgi:hypothetical protein